MDRGDSIFLAGHRGLVGSALQRRLTSEGFTRLLTRTRADLDLTQAAAVDEFFAREKPAIVIAAAARVGGIKANNDQPVEFLLANLQIQNNLIRAAYEHGVCKLLFLGSSCIYPKFAPQPIPESALLGGPLEPTNEAYAIAKIAGIKLCQAYAREYGENFISAMPTNLYGPNDNFDLETSHVLPGAPAQSPRSESSRRARAGRLGLGQAAARISPRRRSRRRLHFSSAELRQLRDHQRRDRRRHFHSGISGADLRDRRF